MSTNYYAMSIVYVLNNKKIKNKNNHFSKIRICNRFSNKSFSYIGVNPQKSLWVILEKRKLKKWQLTEVKGSAYCSIKDFRKINKLTFWL